jgi:hypothetical protein
VGLTALISAAADSDAVPIALIALGGVMGSAIIAGPVMWFLKRFDARNTDQHFNNKSVQEEVLSEVRALRLDFQRHQHGDGKPVVVVIEAKREEAA